MPANGAMTSSAAMTPVPTSIVLRAPGAVAAAGAIAAISAPSRKASEIARAASALLAEESRRAHEQHDDHDDEDHGARRLRIEVLGEALDDAEPEPGEDRAEDRPHAADHDDGEYDDDEVRAHQRIHLVDRCRHDTGERREADAEP